uniref:Small ribosomal subunit protein uS3m n=1 Tax=Colletotrichum salicis TaxID=1209931 RepID=A0A220XK85_9PEZI|nr:ribosomal protein S3 [Colletotrichum salicis]ASL05771.1 ribosomal protein S3 [Colletotrichum salicis]
MKTKALNTNAKIFRSNLNNKFKLTPFNLQLNDLGRVKYLPPVSKEWKNTIYSYYKKNMQNLPIDNINANKIIQSYFNLYFDNKFQGSRLISTKTRSLLLKKIYVSKMETKHTNSKAIVTLYTINADKNNVYKEYFDQLDDCEDEFLNFFKDGLKNIIHGASGAQELLANTNNITLVALGSKNEDQKQILFSKYKFLTESLECFNLYLKLYLSILLKESYSDKLDLLRKYELNYYLNKLKFEKIYLDKLSSILSKIFNKNIEFNIINLKSLAFNPEIFTQALTLKLRKPKSQVIRVMDSLLKVAKLPQVNRIQEKAVMVKSKDFSLLQNAYPNLSLVSILKDSKLINSGSYNSLLEAKSYDTIAAETSLKDSQKQHSRYYSNISNIIFNSIKYKNLGGVRLEVKGRLTRRNRADRSVFKFKWKGGLRDIDSSFKKLSTVTYRGYYKPNVMYSLSASKRRVGSFAVKGWVSGK